MLKFIVGKILNFTYGQRGSRARWNLTVPHGINKEAYRSWELAIAEIENCDGTLEKEWISHVRTGERQNRKYSVDGEMLLLELDRWNGFTISGNTNIAKTIIEKLEAIQSGNNA